MENQVILNNDRDRRTLTWLRHQAGDDAITRAISGLPGDRKPYVSNLCKILGLTPPANLVITDRETALSHLAALRAGLNQQPKA